MMEYDETNIVRRSANRKYLRYRRTESIGLKAAWPKYEWIAQYIQVGRMRRNWVKVDENNGIRRDKHS